MVLTAMDRLFAVFITKFLDLAFLRRRHDAKSGSSQYTEDDDLSLGLYYIRSLSNVLRWAPEGAWAILAKRLVRSDAYQPSLSQISKPYDPVSLIVHSNRQSWDGHRHATPGVLPECLPAMHCS
jgi:hypothetical protein